MAAAMETAEREAFALLEQIQTPRGGSNAEQVTLFQQLQELVLNRDVSGPTQSHLLKVIIPYLSALVQQQNAALGSAVLQLLRQAIQRRDVFLRELYDVCNTMLMLSFTSEKNVLLGLQLVMTSLTRAFQFVCEDKHGGNEEDRQVKAPLWSAVTANLDRVMDVLMSSPFGGNDATNNNRSVLVWLKAWKYLEVAVLLLSTARDATMYRDPSRSNVQPDEITIDRIPNDASFHLLNRDQLEQLGMSLLKQMCERLFGRSSCGSVLTKREWCVSINSLSLIATLRPHFMPIILPRLASFAQSDMCVDATVQATLKANLVKLLSYPSAQGFADEITECLIELGASERAFRAISKSKEPRRKYISAPSEISLRKARIGKRSAAQTMTEKVENDMSKRMRMNDATSTSTKPSTELVTQEEIVNMPSNAVVNLVLEGFASEMPSPVPPNLKLDLPPSELKARMANILATLATPSSALAIENTAKRMRDPRRQRDPRIRQQEQPALAQIFDEATIEEVSDWISKNASSVAEPLISVSEDNVVQVYLKPVTSVWCRDMAMGALSRILENEHGVSISGDEKARERILCRIASSPWLLLTDEQNNPIDSADITGKIPFVYQSILDFILEDYSARSSLAIALLYHEYLRFTVHRLNGSLEEQDRLYRQATMYFFASLRKKLDLNSSADKKLFSSLVMELPRVSAEVLNVVTGLFAEKNGIALGITVLRDLAKERRLCQVPCLRMLLRYTCHDDEGCRNSSIRCVANQLYVIDSLKHSIEAFAIQLVDTLRDNQDTNTVVEDKEQNVDEEIGSSEVKHNTIGSDTSYQLQRVNEQLENMHKSEKELQTELLELADEIHKEADLTRPVDTESETLRRLELYLALCAKKPSLLVHLVAAYAHATEAVRQAIFLAIEKLIKHLKQRKLSAEVVAQLNDFEPNALGLVCHIIQILSVRARPNEEAAGMEELVQQVLTLYHAHEHIPDAISTLIPILPNIRKEILFPLLPQLLSLPPARLSVAITRLLEAMPPQVIAPIDLLIALHHVDLKSEPTMQKKVIQAINFCVEHRHAFPSDVLLHICRVLVEEDRISKLAIRTLILSVTAYPALQQDMTALLDTLAQRKVWEMEDALWKGFVKCAALLQPASFPVLLTKLPLEQLEAVLDEEKDLRPLLKEYMHSSEDDGPIAKELHIAPEVRALLDEPSNAANMKVES